MQQYMIKCCSVILINYARRQFHKALILLCRGFKYKIYTKVEIKYVSQEYKVMK